MLEDELSVEYVVPRQRTDGGHELRDQEHEWPLKPRLEQSRDAPDKQSLNYPQAKQRHDEKRNELSYLGAACLERPLSVEKEAHDEADTRGEDVGHVFVQVERVDEEKQEGKVEQCVEAADDREPDQLPKITPPGRARLVTHRRGGRRSPGCRTAGDPSPRCICGRRSCR